MDNIRSYSIHQGTETTLSWNAEFSYEKKTVTFLMQVTFSIQVMKIT